MRLAYPIVLASLLALPAMAADVVVTTPAPGVVVAPGPGNEARDLNQATKHEDKADRAAENGNFGNAAKQENKADRALNKADRDATGAVVIER